MTMTACGFCIEGRRYGFINIYDQSGPIGYPCPHCNGTGIAPQEDNGMNWSRQVHHDRGENQ